jgi:hypothetical protein
MTVCRLGQRHLGCPGNPVTCASNPQTQPCCRRRARSASSLRERLGRPDRHRLGLQALNPVLARDFPENGELREFLTASREIIHSIPDAERENTTR